MIEQVLNKEVLLVLLASMKEQASSMEGEARRSSVDPEVPVIAEPEELLNDIDKATADLFSDEREERRAGEINFTSLDRNTYIPRSPEVSNLQSAVEAYFLERRPDLIENAADEERRNQIGPIAGERLSIWQIDNDRRVFGAFEETDIRWINALFAQGLRKFRSRHPFVERPVRTTAIPLREDNVRLLVVGDWGSGIPRARKLAEAMRRELDSAKHYERHVIHLGDVYYSGWKYEYARRFLREWPVQPAEAVSIGSFTLNGNHDMYSGGWDYYDYALADTRFAHWQGKSSLFHLANRFWQFLGIDTSYEDGGLAGTQINWLREEVRSERKTVLLSHHQYCSAYEHPASAMIEKIDPLLTETHIAGWLWGHEHRCVSYDEVSGIRYPRCLGHGGVPVYQMHGTSDPIPAPGNWEYRDYIDGGLELWARFGFATLDLHGDKIHMRYLDEEGVEVRTETWT
jgi:hypothetical protein